MILGDQSDLLELKDTLTVEIIDQPFVYGSQAGSIRYWSRRLDGQLWLISPDLSQINALITATAMINNLRFVGRLTDPLQQGEFPRNGSLVVPIGIQEATYELAMALLKDTDLETEYRNLFVTKRDFGSIRTDYDYSLKGPEHIVAGIPSLKAWHLLLPFLSPDRTVKLSRKS